MFIIVYNNIKVVIKISKYYCKDNWNLKVYKPKVPFIDFTNPEWISLRVFISIQQKGKCAMCGKELPEIESTIHHIIPRKNGGENNIENLIGLCNRCHNIAELYELDKHSILNYYSPIKNLKKKKANKNDWHLWVYGGYSRPK